MHASASERAGEGVQERPAPHVLDACRPLSPLRPLRLVAASRSRPGHPFVSLQHQRALTLSASASACASPSSCACASGGDSDDDAAHHAIICLTSLRAHLSGRAA